MLCEKNYQNNISSRDTTIDIVKGISIVLMVWGHSAGPFKHWIYLFHMAVFLLHLAYCGIICVLQVYMDVKLFLLEKLSLYGFLLFYAMPFLILCIIFPKYRNLF